MPAVTVENPLVLPRVIAEPDAVARPVAQVVPAHHAIEGAGFEVWRPFPGGVDTHVADPFSSSTSSGRWRTPPTSPSARPGTPTVASRR